MAKKRAEGICALCRANGPLCESHILPKFLYEPCFHEKFGALAFPGKDRPEPERLFIQDGYKEYLLCRGCEETFQKHETYAARLARAIVEDAALVGQTVRLTDVDSAALKLFMMSILWRCSVSAQDVYARVSLGPHEARLRGMLLNGDPGSPQDYRCFLCKYEGSKGITRTVFQPALHRIDGMSLYAMVALGIEWVTVISGHKSVLAGLDLRTVCVTEKGELSVPVLSYSDADLREKVSRDIPQARRERADRLVQKKLGNRLG